MKNWIMVLGALTVGMGPLVSSANDVAVPTDRFTYGKVVMVDKVVICKKLEWREERVQVEVVKSCWEIRPTKGVCMVPKYFDATKMVKETIVTPRVEIRDVQRCRQVPILMYDKCTGCCFIAHKREPYTVQVKCVREDVKHVCREVPIKVCRMVPQEICYDRKVCVPRTESVPALKRYPVYVPVPVTIRVPQCMPSDRPVPVLPPGLPPHIPGRPY